VKKVMEKNGFKHDQHSGYITNNVMTRIGVYKLLDKVVKELPWLVKTIDVCKLTRFAGDEDIVKHYERAKEFEQII
jgi:virulence-associated protein VapD